MLLRLRKNEANEETFTVLVQRMYKSAHEAMRVFLYSFESIKKRQKRNIDAREGRSLLLNSRCETSVP
jgi:hypothetical protein